MQVFKTSKEISRFSFTSRSNGSTIGLVPTMGALHAGHLELVKRCVSECDVCIVSIYVNPLQFNNKQDLKNYPRDIKKDLEFLKKAGAHAVYLPEDEEMYKSSPEVSIDFGHLSNTMEGAHRPGHFKGVGIVVSKLFHHCTPDQAYFGLKDLQQFLIIQRMAIDLSFPVKVIGHQIIRENSGLALSSRNSRLSKGGLSIASNIYKGLEQAKDAWESGKTPNETKLIVNDFYKGIEGLEIEYFEIVNASTLQNVHENSNQNIAICTAGYVEGIRLIDNLYLRQD